MKLLAQSKQGNLGNTAKKSAKAAPLIPKSEKAKAEESKTGQPADERSINELIEEFLESDFEIKASNAAKKALQ